MRGGFRTESGDVIDLAARRKRLSSSRALIGLDVPCEKIETPGHPGDISLVVICLVTPPEGEGFNHVRYLTHRWIDVTVPQDGQSKISGLDVKDPYSNARPPRVPATPLILAICPGRMRLSGGLAAHSALQRITAWRFESAHPYR